MFVQFSKVWFIFIVLLLLGRTGLSMEDWDPQLYRDSSEMQGRWAEEALMQIKFGENDNVLDVGSGPGTITSTIAKLTGGNVVGIDLSKNMVRFGNRKVGQRKVLFFPGDAHELLFDKQFDVVTSFSTLHRLKNLDKVFEGIARALVDGGRFVAVFPLEGSPLISDAITVVDSREKWKGYFAEHSRKDRKDYSLSEADLEKVLKRYFTVVNLRLIREVEIFPTRDKFRDLLRATSMQRQWLTPEQEIAFFDEVVDEYLKKVPLDGKRVLFYFNRVVVTAVKIGTARL